MITVPTRAILVAGCVLFVACGVMVGAAAADNHGEDDEWTVGFDGEVDVADNGGDGGFTCTGMPTDHDCDKGSDFYAGPVTVEYDGYNRGSLDGGAYEFEDRFVVTDEDGQGAVVVVPCEFQDDAPEDNPCPATADQYDGDGQDGDGQDDDRGDGGDGDGDPDASDDRRDNGDDDGNANDEDNASDERDDEDDDSDDSEAPVDVDADVTVDPPSDGPGL